MAIKFPHATVAVLLVALAAIVAYFNSCHSVLIWEDHQWLAVDVGTPLGRQIGDLAAGRALMAMQPGRAIETFSPLSAMTFRIDYKLWGKRAQRFHLTNIFLHLLVSVLLLLLLRSWLNDKWTATVAALLFAVHPLNTETVGYLSGRPGLLTAVFIFICLLLLTYGGRAGEGKSRWRRSLALLGGLLSLAIALTASTTAIAGLFLILLLIYFILAEKKIWPTIKGSWLILLSLIPVAFYLLWRTTTGPKLNLALERMSGLEWAFTSLSATTTALIKLAFPVDLSAFARTPLLDHPMHLIVIGGAVFILVTPIVGLSRKASPVVGLALAWLLDSLIVPLLVLPESYPPELGLPLAERFLYLPTVSFCLLAAWAIRRAGQWAVAMAPNWKPAQMSANGLALILCLILMVGTWKRNEDYSDEVKFFSAVLEKNPDSALVQNQMARAFVIAGDPGQALLYARQAVDLGGNHLLSDEFAADLASILTRLGNKSEAGNVVLDQKDNRQDKIDRTFDLAQRATNAGDCRTALRHYQKTLTYKSDHLESLLGMADCYRKLDRYENALYVLEKAGRVEPQNAQVAYLRANTLVELLRTEEAADAYRQALAGDPGHVEALIHLGAMLVEMQQFEEAESVLKRAVDRDPQRLESRLWLTRLLLAADRFDEALMMAQSTLATDPGSVDGQLLLARIYLAQKRKILAEATVRRLLKNQPDDVRAKNLLEEILH